MTTNDITADQAAKFDAMLKLEWTVRMDRLGEGMAPTSWERERSATSREASQAKLFAALDALSPTELALYGQYRAEVAK